jgi:transposase
MILSGEWKYEDWVAVREREAREDEREKTARNALREGASVEFIQKITGLDTRTITGLSRLG